MNPPPSKGVKRKQSRDSDPSSPGDATGTGLTAKPVSPATPHNGNPSASTASSFRNVSACNRCRLRKNRCDQRLPACASCEKAHIACVGYDPITKKEIPRSYVYYCESRISHLENLLQSNGIPFPPPEHFTLSYKSGSEQDVTSEERHNSTGAESKSANGAPAIRSTTAASKGKEQNESEGLSHAVSGTGKVPVQEASDPRYLGSASGISFARVVFAAVKSSFSGHSSERGSVRPGKPSAAATASGTSMRDSFFRLHTKPTVRKAPFPDRELGLRLVDLYFEHANPQIPILHRGEFMSLFDRAYAADESKKTPREAYMLNIVFAIGAGIIMDGSDLTTKELPSVAVSPSQSSSPGQSHKRAKLEIWQYQPEEYHASAIVHLESFLGSTSAADRSDGFGGGLEALQAVLLLAGFALLRPVAPGLWYIIGVAVRLGVDLGLHSEDGVEIDDTNTDRTSFDEHRNNNTEASKYTGALNQARAPDAKERGRKQWVRDLQRRLWWCVYSFDRLVSTCVGRPFGITDQVITTEFPSLLDDKYITTAGFQTPPSSFTEIPSYKHVSHHYFRLRLLQSEILQVLQHRQVQQARALGANQGNQFMHTRLASPFLQNFMSFREWRLDIDRRLWEWKESAPTQQVTGVQFSPLFLELNYWQAVIMLYRQSLSVPPVLAGEMGEAKENEEVQSPGMVNVEEREDQERVFLKVAEAGQRVLKLYRQLHRVRLVNYTFLATHHLFMAGISFLYAIWHSAVVRSHLSLDDVDFTVLAATSVLGDLIAKCPPAEACRDAFDRMSKATIQMCLSTTGFGEQAAAYETRRQGSTYQRRPYAPEQRGETAQYGHGQGQQTHANPQQNARRPRPKFDMNLGDLFHDRTSSSEYQQRHRTPPHLFKLESASALPTYPQSTQPNVLHQQHHPPLPPFATSPGRRADSLTTDPSASANIDPALRFSPQSYCHLSMPAYPASNLTTTTPFPALDFLTNSSSRPDHDALDFDLGFGAGGMAWDGSGGGGGGGDGWSEGGGFDLFDGFFFGGGAGNGTNNDSTDT
ncbi:fungal-specific transcription factor domain-containing protein [Cryomyces antarcticus]